MAGRTHQRQQAVGVDPLVPDGEFALAGQLAKRRTVRGCRLQRGAVGLRVAVAVLAGGDRDARGEALDVPLERAGERLVEVVQVEELGAFRGGVQAEVEEVGVAAELDREAGVRLGRQVAGHHGGRAAQERERGGGHAAVPDRQEFRESVPALPFEYGDGVRAVHGGVPAGVGRAGHAFARGAASLGPVRRGGHVPCLCMPPPSGMAPPVASQ